MKQFSSRRVAIYGSALGLLLATGIPAVTAQTSSGSQIPTQTDSTDSNNVEEVIITGWKSSGSEIALELEQFGNSVQVVTSDQIAAGGFANFAELAQGLIRGANVGYSPDEGEYTIRLDGGTDRDTLVTMDGVPLYDRGPGVENIWGATLIDPRMIERVEIFRGGQSLYFGSNGGLGLVNIITKEPDGTFKGDGGLRYGSFDSREIWGNIAFPVSDDKNHSMMLYGGRSATEGHRIFAKDAFVDNMAAAGGIEDYSNSRDNIGVKYRWNIDGSSHFLANLQYVQINFQDTFPDSTLYGYITSRMPLLNLRYQKNWSDRIHSEITFSYRQPQLFHNKVQPEICRIETGCPATNGSGNIIPYGSWTGNITPLANRGFGNFSVKGGFEEFVLTNINTIRVSESLETVIGVQSLNYRDKSEAVININDDLFTTNGIFADLRITPRFSPSTSLSIAGRVDNGDELGTESIWKIGFRQPFGGGFYVRANGGTSYSLPQTNELYVETETAVGNPDLKPEETESYNYGLGMDRNYGGRRVMVELGGFYTDITNRIRGTVGQVPSSWFNDSAITEIRGVTVDMEVEINSNWIAGLSYTASDATPKGSDEQINATPEWFATANIRWKSNSNRYHASILPRLQGPEWIAGPNGLPDLNYGDWFLLNATADYWAGDKYQHKIQLRLVNILDETYGERGAFGSQTLGSAFIRGEISRTDPEFNYPYIFEGKPRSAFITYSYSF